VTRILYFAGLLFLFATALTFATASVFANSEGPEALVYEGTDGPGLGKHIVFLAGDHEYRSEQTLPALARILAKHHGLQVYGAVHA